MLSFREGHAYFWSCEAIDLHSKHLFRINKKQAQRTAQWKPKEYQHRTQKRQSAYYFIFYYVLILWSNIDLKSNFQSSNLKNVLINVTLDTEYLGKLICIGQQKHIIFLQNIIP